MKKMVVLILILICFCFVGCSNEKEVSSLGEYEMVEGVKIKEIA